MVNFEGKYKLESDSNFLELYAALGAPEESLNAFGKPGDVVDVTKDSDDTYSFQIEGKAKITWTFGKQFNYLFGSVPVQGVAQRDGNKILVESALTSTPSNKVTRVYEFTNNGYTVTATHGNKKGTRVYVRI